MFKYSEAKLKALIDGIFDGSISEYELPESLYVAIAAYFEKGLYKGFGMTLADAVGKDFELLAELRENVWLFSAAKTFQQVKEIGGFLIDDEDRVRTAKEFNEMGRAAFEQWNTNWGTTEYNTAIGQAQSASKWNEIEKNKDVLTMLRYSAVMDKNTSDICRPLNGIIAPVSDKIWDTIAPENHFSCRCILLQETSDVTATPDDEKAEKVGQVEKEMQDMFKMNPGKSGYVFSEDHPYFQVEKKDREFARTNFGLPLPTEIKEKDESTSK